MRPSFIIAVLAGFAALPIFFGPARAQANRTFVSGHGADTNACSLAAPCRSFAQAITQTNAGGEITILDPAGYGSVTITKSISIVNDGVGEAGVTVTSATDAIDISIGTSDVVNLRGLTLVGSGSGLRGIQFNNLGALNIQNCVIRGFAVGLALSPAGTAAFNVSDTIVSGIGLYAISLVTSGTGTVTGAFNRVQAIGSGIAGFIINGGDSTGAVNVTIANSAATNNDVGIQTESFNGEALTQVMVSNSVVSNNNTGVEDAGANSTTYLAKNTIAGNGVAFNVNTGSLFSFGDNYIRGNSNDGGAISLVSTK
jgi:hypothetical protein